MKIQEDIRLIACPHPFSIQRVDRITPHGKTISEILADAGIGHRPGVNARVMVEDELIPERLWDTYIPHPGAVVTVRVVPMGGGGGKDPLRTLLSIAVIALAGFAGPYVAGLGIFAKGGALAGMGGVAGALTTVGATAVGMLAVNAIAPPPQANLSLRTGNVSFEQSASLSGMRNQINRYGPVPAILGCHRVYPPFGAAPYTEIVGDDQYLRCLFIAGRGPLALSDFKIGETDIDEFEVELEFREGYDGDSAITLFTESIYEEALNIELTEAGGFETRTTQEDADEISVDITFPQGLVEFTESGTKSSLTVEFEIQYSPTGEEDWSIGYIYEAVEAQESASMPTPAMYPTENVGQRIDRVVIDKSTGVISVITGQEVPTKSDQWNVFTGRTPKAPPVPGWACPIAQVIRRAGDNTISDSDITDERSSCLLKQNPGDFAPSAQDPESTKIDVAAGDLKVVLTATSARPATLRKTFRFSVAQGQYDVRIRRETADRSGDGQYDTAYWTALRTITHEDPVQETGLAMVALRIKATDQLNGILDTFNCVAHSIVKDWDANFELWIERPTNNPASLYRAVLQHPSNKKALSDSRIDLEALQTWHDNNKPRVMNIGNAAAVDKGGGKVGIPCTGHDYEDGVPIWLNNTDNYDGRHTVDATSTENEIVITATYQAETFDGDEIVSGLGRTYNQPVDFRISIEDLLREIAAAGRAAPAYIDGKYSIVEDKAQTVPVQHFTPRNSWGFSARKQFIDMPHAFRVRFPNEEKDFREDERIVYDDGYSAENATKFEQLELPGITHTDLVYVHGRYHMACAQLRPEVYSFYADVEHIVCTRGDLIRMTHDVPMWGVSWGRIKSVTDNGTHATAVKMDEIMSMVAEESYCIRFRKKDGETLLANVDTNPGEQTTLTFTTPILLAEAPEVGDLGLFGEQGSESIELIVKSIEPGSDLTARITAVDAAPAVHASDTSEIPDYDSQMTLPYDIPDAVGYPVVDSTKIRSDETVLVRDTDGSLRPRIMIPFTYVAGFMFDQVGETWIWYRENGSDGPWKNIIYDQYVSEGWIENVEEGVTYEFVFRYKLSDGRRGPSSPTPNILHTVIGKSTAPAKPTGVSATAIISGIRLGWTNPTVMDFKSTFIYRHTSDVFDEGNLYKVIVGQPGQKMVFVDTDVVYGTNYYYWLKSCDTSGNTSDETSSVSNDPNHVQTSDIADLAITTGKINDLAVTEAKLANLAVTTGKINNLAVTADQIANATITGGKIASLTIEAGNIAASTITGDKIANLTITAGKIGNNEITAGQIAALTITAAEIANSTITGAKIASSTIEAGNIANSTITGGKIAASTITGGNISSQTIQAGNILNLTITAAQIANLTITGGPSGKIAGSTITEDNIVANTITATSIAANTITCDQIAANTITASEIFGNTITAAEIAAATITATQIKGTGFGTLTITSGKIAINTADALEIQASGNVKVLAGADIVMVGSDTNPGLLTFYGTSYSTQIGGDVDGNRYVIRPSANDVVECYIGIDGAFWGEAKTLFKYINIWSQRNVSITGYDLAVTLISKDSGSVVRRLDFDGDSFFPYYDNQADLGIDAKRWKTGYFQTGIGIGSAAHGAPASLLEVQGHATYGKQLVTLDQDDQDQPFIDFQGATAADTTKSISTVAIGFFTHAGMLQMEVNGEAGCWIPYYVY